MNSTIKIHFKGLAACHYNGSNWEVFFVCDKTHLLNFYDISSSSPKISLSKAKSINIKAEGSVVPRRLSAAQDEECRDFEKVFDMTAAYSHNNGVRRKQSGAESAGDQTDCVKLTLENAFFYSVEQTDKKYTSIELVNNRPTGFKRDIGYVTNVVGATIVFDGTGQLKVEVDGVTIHSDDYDSDSGKLLELVFDNNCASGKCHQDSDFRMYYNLLEDKTDESNKKREFEVKVDENVKPFDKNGLVMTPGRVNCYPVRISDEMLLDSIEE